MTEAATIPKPELHQEPEHVIEGSPRGQLPERFAQLFHPLERIIEDADAADSMAATVVDHHDGFVWRTYRLRAECVGKRIRYEVKNQFGAIVRGEMDRSEA